MRAITAALLLSCPVAVADDDPSKKDLALFEGTWRIESMEILGKQIAIDGVKDARLTLKGDSFVQEGLGPAVKGTFVLDATKTPKTIDLKFTEGPGAGKTVRGLYEIDADTYKLCSGDADGERPKEFSSAAIGGGVVQVLKRVKP